ncbi:hypothetical protein NGC23_20110 [Leclercia pneumoniae]|uniref:hypothetical protein n=1 Tax=Leclercia pneumoniae TaxID=2815358 RepID=UPI002DBB2FA0|nr:hypothetical protein [Leclercia pneumoniae]MEB7502472.1 hypothetical protein [Leclercia pneumoniae]
MRDKAEHDARLKNIRRDLKGWEEDEDTRSNFGIVMGMGGLFVFGFSILSFSLEGWMFISTLLIWVVVCKVMIQWLFRRYGTTWAQEMDIKLAQYHPEDLRAWDELQQSVAEQGVTLEAVQRWSDLELQAVTPSPAEQKWEMLQNKHGAQCTTTPEQPVKPDTNEV